MNNHYIPRLLLRHFSENNKVNVYNYKTDSAETTKIKNIFCEDDIFSDELEKKFCNLIEAPFGSLLNNKLLKDKDEIIITRDENLIMRKFFLLEGLRNTFVLGTYEDILEKGNSYDHPDEIRRQALIKMYPQIQELYDKHFNKGEEMRHLELIANSDTIEDLSDKLDQDNTFSFIKNHISSTLVHATAIWDCKDTGEEFILPKLHGIMECDVNGPIYKSIIISNRLTKTTNPNEEKELLTALYGGKFSSENYTINVISPTRIIVNYPRYFRLFFPTTDILTNKVLLNPIFDKTQFDKHFWKAPRMELFSPCTPICENIDKAFYEASKKIKYKNIPEEKAFIRSLNQKYKYKVKKLTTNETYSINSLMLNTEFEQFVFHDFNKIINSLWYYDNIAKFVPEKRHSFKSFY